MSKKTAPFVFIVLFGVYVGINIYSSQQYDPLFFHLVGRRQKSDAVTFLKKIQKTALFAEQLAVFKNSYGQTIVADLAAGKQKREKEIIQLETLLTKNKDARDVLVKLAIIYYEDDQPSRAKSYYQKAKTIDPTINISQLDKL